MKRWAIFGLSALLLTGCTDTVSDNPIPIESPDEPITEWTREDFKDVYDQYEQTKPLLTALEQQGIKPFRETFERVIIAGNGLEHTYADIYPFKLDDGTYATIFDSQDGTVINGSESVAPLFWQEESFLQYVEEIENRKFGTSAPPTDVVLTQDEFQTVYDRHAYTSALLVELDEAGVELAREPIDDVIIAGNGVTEVTADLFVFDVESGYAIVYDQDGEILKGPESISPLFWNEKDYEDLLAKNEG
ncbi:hypothetical protein [Exiguobacterium sp. s131]|uniref:hypothetical protein n=1 Tax=Exiguobacterium sp. s131 TaxID=2751278 RepID=UPI001BEB3ABF|nr:hypothetical protein [Exiguobacterium sp. s131]